MTTFGEGNAEGGIPRTARRLRAGIAALLLLAALGLAAPMAGAKVTRLAGHAAGVDAVRAAKGGSGHGAKPAAGGKGVTYHGGPVMTSNTNTVIYWDPSGGAAFPAEYESGIDAYFQAVAADSGSRQTIDSVLAQYYGPEGSYATYDSHFAGSYVDSDSYPPSGCTVTPRCLTDEQLRDELRAFIEAHGLPEDLAHAYFLVTPDGVESCMSAESTECSSGAPGKDATFCAYHGDAPGSSGPIVYADIPYMVATKCETSTGHPNGNLSDAALEDGLAHEHAETVTDPELNGWYESKSGDEIADKCRTGVIKKEFGEPLGTAADGSPYNQIIDGRLYWYQMVWSNDLESCQQRVAVLPTIKKLSPKKGPAAGGTEITITGAHFSSPATVTFGGVEGTVQSVTPTSIRVITPQGVDGPVRVVVTTGEGGSPESKKDIFKYSK